MASFNVGEEYKVINNGTQYCSFLKPGNDFIIEKILPVRYKIKVEAGPCLPLTEDELKEITRSSGGGKRSSKKSKKIKNNKRKKSKRKKKSKQKKKSKRR